MTAQPKNKPSWFNQLAAPSTLGVSIFFGRFSSFRVFEEMWVIQQESKSVDEKVYIKSCSKQPLEMHFLGLPKGTPHEETTTLKT